MKSHLKRSLSFFITLLVFTTILHEIAAAGCVDNQACTDLCGYAGEGTCVDGKYCKCADCPQRNVFELVNLPKICTLDPTCLCPAPKFSLTSGKIYSGHRCLHGTSLVCICFCMPTTVGSLVDVVKCPFPKNITTTTANPVENVTFTTESN